MSESEVIIQAELKELTAKLKREASWFYWIGGLSLLNSILTVTNAGIVFVVGLGITQFIDGVGYGLSEAYPNLANIISWGAVLVTAILSGIFILFGWLGMQLKQGLYLTGIILYILDTLIILPFQDWLSLGFHALALFGLFKGLQTLKAIKQLMTEGSIPTDDGNESYI
jgi:hypothetical protein